MGRFKLFLIIVICVSIIFPSVAAIYLNVLAGGRSYIYLEGYPISYAETSFNNSINKGYILLHPNDSLTLTARTILKSNNYLTASSFGSVMLKFKAPPWLRVIIQPNQVGNNTLVRLTFTASKGAPLGIVSSVEIYSNSLSSSLKVYLMVVPSDELVVPQKAVLIGNSSGYQLKASFLVNYDSQIDSISASLSPGNIIMASNSTYYSGLSFPLSVQSPEGEFVPPFNPLPVVYTLTSKSLLPARIIHNMTYSLQVNFTFSDGRKYYYMQNLTPEFLTSSTYPMNTSTFTIIMDSQGYNDSILHGAPLSPWPIIQIEKNTQVTIIVINNDTIETHGFAINYYFDRGIAVPPGGRYTFSFTADRAGNFTIYCNVPCSIHVYMIAMLEVKG